MPKQNRVTPFGDIIATSSRGTLMGNRGCLHDADRRIRRQFACRRWIICVLEFRGRYRVVMSPGRYTELFFLDEATALAAGHRPCAECQRERYLLFRGLWGAANGELAGSSVPSADAMDEVLHSERLDNARMKRTYSARVGELPPGAMIVGEDDVPYLVRETQLLPWDPAGYGPGVPKVDSVACRVLTPRSTVRALAAGYPVSLHPSAEQPSRA